VTFLCQGDQPARRESGCQPSQEHPARLSQPASHASQLMPPGRQAGSGVRMCQVSPACQAVSGRASAGSLSSSSPFHLHSSPPKDDNTPLTKCHLFHPPIRNL